MIGATIAERGIATDIREVEKGKPSRATTPSWSEAPSTWATGSSPAREFVERHAGELAAMPTWLFSSGPIGDPPKPGADAAVKIDDLVAAAHARDHRLFAGRLEMLRSASRRARSPARCTPARATSVTGTSSRNGRPAIADALDPLIGRAAQG